MIQNRKPFVHLLEKRQFLDHPTFLKIIAIETVAQGSDPKTFVEILDNRIDSRTASTVALEVFLV